MKTLSELYIDNRVAQYFIEQFKLFVYCRLNVIHESLGRFDNYIKVQDIIKDFISKLPKDFEEKEYKIDVSSANSYINNVYADIKHANDELTSGGFERVTKEGDVFISLELGPDFKSEVKTDSITGLILHELLHGYEEYNRLVNGKESIFNDFTEEYKIAFKNISKSDWVVSNLVTLLYFLNFHERLAYMSGLFDAMDKIIKKIKPTINDLKTNEVFNELTKEGIWKRYFDFGKFIINLDNIDNEELEDIYSMIYELPEDKLKRIKSRQELLKILGDKAPKRERVVVKTASQIKKECKAKWNKFKSKFDSLFIKIYCECIPTDNKKQTYETLI